MRRWKLSGTDLSSITKWEEYSRAKDTMMVHTDVAEAPWYEVESDDKWASRINMITHLLSKVPWEKVEWDRFEIPPRPAAGGYERPPRASENSVPDVAQELIERHRAATSSATEARG